jgi:RNA polymerase sigma-70 factor, ECF subfamily
MDADLVARAQAGDRLAFERLAVASVERLNAVAFSILGDVHLGEDATQQALLNIWRDLPGLRDPARFAAWSYRVVVRACYSEARRRPNWLPNVMDGRDPEPPAADGLSHVSDRDELERGFRRLSIDQRAVVVLHFYADLPLDQVADVLGVPVGTAHSRLNRAMNALRAALAADARPRTLEPAPERELR